VLAIPNGVGFLYDNARSVNPDLKDKIDVVRGKGCDTAVSISRYVVE
jgi:hypothetical protein